MRRLAEPTEPRHLLIGTMGSRLNSRVRDYIKETNSSAKPSLYNSPLPELTDATSTN